MTPTKNDPAITFWVVWVFRLGMLLIELIWLASVLYASATMNHLGVEASLVCLWLWSLGILWLFWIASNNTLAKLKTDKG